MRKLSAAIVLYFGLAFAALAQSTFTMPPPAGVTVVGVQVVTTCGAASLTNNAVAFLAMDTTGTLCTKGSSGGTTTVVGTTSNASSGVATSATNIASVAYNYAFNGTTWDQIKSKAASTAAVATDTSVVTQLNPLSPGIIALGPATVSGSIPFTYSSQYPTNATTTTPTAVTATASGTTAATAASLGATASVTNFVCGFTITADATALATGTATLSGTISGSLSYLQTIVAVTSGASVLTQNFNPCIPASAANTAITITSAAAGTGGNTIVNIWGYRL